MRYPSCVGYTIVLEAVELSANIELRERLADLAHETWASWMNHLFVNSMENADGSVTIPPELVARWRRQMVTPYGCLSESEQDSDRREALKALSVLVEHGTENG